MSSGVSRPTANASLGIGNTCNGELQPETTLVNTIELYWQDVQKEMLFLIPSSYMHIWLSGVQAILRKAISFILSFDKT